jgi:hypothetical protein
MKRPDKFPEFANNDELDSISGQPNVKEPSQPIKDSGWNRKQDIYKQYLNWLHRTNNDWIVWLDSLIDPVINEDFTTVINQAVRTVDSPTFVNLNLEGYEYIDSPDSTSIILKRARGTFETPLAIQQNDQIGSLAVRGYNGSSFVSISRAIVEFNASENWNTNANGTYIRFITTKNGTLTTAEKLRITDIGNIGIGTTNPLEKLHVNGSVVFYNQVDTGNAYIKLISGSLGQAKIILQPADSSAMVMGLYAHNTVHRLDIVDESENPKVTILSNGNMGIGTTNPTEKLQVEGLIKIYSRDSSSSALQCYGYNRVGNAYLGSYSLDDAVLSISTSDGNEKVMLNSNGISYLNGGSIGIGTNNPLQTLDVRGNAIISGNAAVGKTILEAWASSCRVLQLGGISSIMCTSAIEVESSTYLLYNAYNDTAWKPIISSNVGSLRFGTDGFSFYYDISKTADIEYVPTLIMRLSGSGNLGIGTNDPLQTLDVRGNTIISGNAAVGKTTVESWNSGFKALQVGGVFSIIAPTTENDGTTYFLNNSYYDDAWKAVTNGNSAIFKLGSTGFGFYFNSGLTTDNIFIPIEIMSLSTTGILNIPSLTASCAIVTDVNKNLVSSIATDIEVSYLSGVTSSIQTQLNSKQTTVINSYISNPNLSYTFVNFAAFTIESNTLAIAEYRWHLQNREVHTQKDCIVYLGVRYNNSTSYIIEFNVFNTGSNPVPSLYITSIDGITFNVWIKTESTVGYNTYFKLTEEMAENSYGTITYKNIGITDVSLTNIVSTATISNIWATDMIVSGKVGIGTTNPNYPLHVVGDIGFSGALQVGTVPWARLSDLPDTVITLGGDCSGSVTLTDLGSATLNVTVSDDSHAHDGRYYTETEADNRFLNLNGGNIIGSLNIAGNIGIGTTNPTYQLQLTLDSAAKPSTNTWTVASDIRVKKNIEGFNKYGLNDLLKLRPVKFQYNGLAGFMDDNKYHIGYIAQEVEQIIPEMVSSIKTKLNINDKEEIDLKNINTHLLTFAIIEALREIKNQLDKKDNKILNLEKIISEVLIRIDSLENKNS